MEEMDNKSECEKSWQVEMQPQNKKDLISKSTLNVHTGDAIHSKEKFAKLPDIDSHPQIEQRLTSILKVDVHKPDENTRESNCGAEVRPEKKQVSSPKSKMDKVDEKLEAVVSHKPSKCEHAKALLNDRYHYTRIPNSERRREFNKVPSYVNHGPQISGYRPQPVSHWYQPQNNCIKSLDYESQPVHFSKKSPFYSTYMQPPGDEYSPCGASAADHCGKIQRNSSPPLELINYGNLAQQSQQPIKKSVQGSHQVNKTTVARVIPVSSSDPQEHANKKQQSVKSSFELNAAAVEYITKNQYKKNDSAECNFLGSYTVHQTDRVKTPRDMNGNSFANVNQLTCSPNHSKHMCDYQEHLDHHFVVHCQHCGIQPQFADSRLTFSQDCRSLYECVRSASSSGAPAMEGRQQPQCAASQLHQSGSCQQPVVTKPAAYRSQVMKNEFNPHLAWIWQCLRDPKRDDWMGLVDPEGVVKMNLKHILKVEHLHLANCNYTEFQRHMPNFNVLHILEMYDITRQLQTSQVLRYFKSWLSGLVLKWVDNTHLIVAFLRADDAKAALETPCPIGKLRYLRFATTSSKLMAVKNSLV